MQRIWSIPILIVAGALLAASCGGNDAEPMTTSSTVPPTTTSTAPPPADGEHVGVACQYVNPFTGDDECRRYVGAGWDDAGRAEDCAAPFSTTVGTLVSDGCALEQSTGTCRIGGGESDETLTFYYTDDTVLLAQFCANPGGGVWADSGESPVVPTTVVGAMQSEVAAAMISTASVAVDPECTDEPCIASLVQAGDALEFTPLTQTPQAGLILFPGASVDARAYAPLAQIIADAGFFVAIVPVPGGVSLGNEDRAGGIVAAHPEIDTWFVGGHSLGGVAAARFIANESAESVISGLVLWAAYLDGETDISKVPLEVVSIYGTQDGLTTVGEVEANRNRLPADTRYVKIEGGNHAQFGFYGAQEGDGAALIDLEVQARLVAETSAHFMAGVVAGSPRVPDIRYAAGGDLEDDWCEGSQSIIANLASPIGAVQVEELRDEREFVESKPSVDDAGVVNVPMHRFPIGQHSALDAPPILTGELWCKHKSQGSFVVRGAIPAGDPGSCAAANRAAWEWALAELTEAERRTWESAGIDVVFAPDLDHDTGPAWLAGGVDVVRTDGTVTIVSSRLAVAVDAGLEDQVNTGLAYCKLWTPSEALRLALNP